jgi:zinc/manganese transport system substrate-binding protein
MKHILLIILSLLMGNVWAAELKLVATTSSMGVLAREVGAEQVSIKVLAPPDRDAHYLQAKPSMMRDLRSADLVLAIGAELEIGWLPMALQSANNPRIQIGKLGYFEAAAQVDLIDAGKAADRAQGDVHPLGNPHVNLDPLRMAQIAQALAQRLSTLDAAHAELYQQRAQNFTKQVEARLPQWQAQVQTVTGVVLHHKDADYLMKRLNVPILGYIEPIAGIPTTASHLKSLLEKLKTYPSGVIIRSVFHPPQGAAFLAKELGWANHALPLDPPLNADGAAYLNLIDQWVTAIQ